jgi:hypothetical protein
MDGVAHPQVPVENFQIFRGFREAAHGRSGARIPLFAEEPGAAATEGSGGFGAQDGTARDSHRHTVVGGDVLCRPREHEPGTSVATETCSAGGVGGEAVRV